MKPIDSTVWTAVESAYLNRAKVNYTSLAKEFNISISSIKKRAATERWSEKRKRVQAEKQAIKADTALRAIRDHPKQDSYQLLNNAIADIYAEGTTLKGKTKEGCFSSLTQLLKAMRELYPPTADELAEMAFKLGIKPQDFIDALTKRWEESMPVANAQKEKA